MVNEKNNKKETDPVIAGVGAGALTLGVGALVQFVSEKQQGLSLQKTKDVLKTFEGYKELYETNPNIVTPFFRLNGISGDLGEFFANAVEMAENQKSSIINNRLMFGCAVAAVAVGTGIATYLYVSHENEKNNNGDINSPSYSVKTHNLTSEKAQSLPNHKIEKA
jgi:hypothetical protein